MVTEQDRFNRKVKLRDDRLRQDIAKLEEEVAKLTDRFDEVWKYGPVWAACFERTLNAQELLSLVVELNTRVDRGLEDYLLNYDHVHARRHGIPVEQVTAERHASYS